MKTNSCTGLRTYGKMVKNAIPTGYGRYTTAKDVEAFFASLAEDFFPKGKAWPERKMPNRPHLQAPESVAYLQIPGSHRRHL